MFVFKNVPKFGEMEGEVRQEGRGGDGRGCRKGYIGTARCELIGGNISEVKTTLLSFFFYW